MADFNTLREKFPGQKALQESTPFDNIANNIWGDSIGASNNFSQKLLKLLQSGRRNSRAYFPFLPGFYKDAGEFDAYVVTQ